MCEVHAIGISVHQLLLLYLF